MSTSHYRAENSIERAIAEQAAAWFVAHRERELSTQEREEFLHWLQASPLHVREYLAIAKMSVNVRAVAEHASESVEALVAAARDELPDNVVVLVPPVAVVTGTVGLLHKQTLLFSSAATIAALAIGVFLFLNSSYAPLHEDYRTAHGEQRTVRLKDGSVLHINSDSIVRVDFSHAERRVAMERGQALFKVAKDPSRPFRVRAGSTEVVAVGTEFDVRRSADDVVVTVVEGQVAVAEVTNPQVPSINRSTNSAAMPIRLAAGQQARVATSGAPMVRRAVDVRPAVAWVQQQIVFERQTLQEVITEFNRYGATPMVIEDSEIAGLRVSGVFNAYDLDSFVLYLENLNGLVVKHDADRIRISLTRKYEGDRT